MESRERKYKCYSVCFIKIITFVHFFATCHQNMFDFLLIANYRDFALQLTDTSGNVLARITQEPNARYFKILLDPRDG